GAGKAGEPAKPLLRGRHVFVLLAVGTRHDETSEAAACQFGPQRRDARRAGSGLGRIVECLKLGFEHKGNLLSGAPRGNAPASHVSMSPFATGFTSSRPMPSI